MKCSPAVLDGPARVRRSASRGRTRPRWTSEGAQPVTRSPITTVDRPGRAGRCASRVVRPAGVHWSSLQGKSVGRLTTSTPSPRLEDDPGASQRFGEGRRAATAGRVETRGRRGTRRGRPRSASARPSGLHRQRPPQGARAWASATDRGRGPPCRGQGADAVGLGLVLEAAPCPRARWRRPGRPRGPRLGRVDAPDPDRDDLEPGLASELELLRQRSRATSLLEVPAARRPGSRSWSGADAARWSAVEESATTRPTGVRDPEAMGGRRRRSV